MRKREKKKRKKKVMDKEVEWIWQLNKVMCLATSFIFSFGDSVPYLPLSSWFTRFSFIPGIVLSLCVLLSMQNDEISSIGVWLSCEWNGSVMLVVIVLVVVVVDEFRFLLVPRGFVSLRIGILTPCFAKHWDNAVGAIITISFPILSLSLSLFTYKQHLEMSWLYKQ